MGIHNVFVYACTQHIQSCTWNGHMYKLCTYECSHVHTYVDSKPLLCLHTGRCDEISNLWQSLWEQSYKRRKRLEVAAGFFKVFEGTKTVLHGVQKTKDVSFMIYWSLIVWLQCIVLTYMYNMCYMPCIWQWCSDIITSICNNAVIVVSGFVSLRL